MEKNASSTSVLVTSRPCPGAFLTVPAHHHRRGRAEGGGVGHHVSHSAGVVAGVRGLHLGDEEVARLLGDEAPSVVPQEASPAVHHPGELHRWQGSSGGNSKSSLLTWKSLIGGFDVGSTVYCIKLSLRLLNTTMLTVSELPRNHNVRLLILLYAACVF